MIVASVAACTTYQDPATRTDGINDPYENANRKVHAFNKGLDSELVRPVSQGYSNVPVEVRDRVNDFSDNLSEPGNVINKLLQGKFADAGIATSRFVVNTTLGFVGLVDSASALNIPEQKTDFGETLAVWGVGEGAYVELPLFGPSTQRDAVGLFTDFFTNPLTFFTIDSNPEQFIPPTARGGAYLNDRTKFSNTFDSVLYESADSYAQARSVYLQNRRFELEGSDATDIDPYVDPYSELGLE
ncbi:MAG: VacJ family lipoprotein [Pseudomonadota bacterium]